MSTEKLTQEAVQSALLELEGWDIADGKLHRKFKFPDFPAALSFMVAIGCVAEKHNHHPEWFNVYNRVEVWLTTHDAGGITQLDIMLASAMSRHAG